MTRTTRRTVFPKFARAVGVGALLALSLVTTARAATGPGTLAVTTTPAGVTLIAPTCYTVTWGTCGVTSWTSTDLEGIPPTTYTFPLTAVAGGLHYVLVTGHLTGCNLGTPGTTGDQCRVSVERGVIGVIHADYRLVPPAPVPPCATGAPNLVLNPSFESVTGAGIYTGSTNPLETWWYIATPGSSMVPHWTTTTPSNDPAVFNAGLISGVTQTAGAGVRYVGVGMNDLSDPSGMRGVLTPAPVIGTTYVLSALVRSVDWPVAGVISLRLVNSGSGASSAVVYATSTPQASGYTLVGAAVVATGYYNNVVVGYSQGGGAARIDMVRVCRAVTGMSRRAPVHADATRVTASTPQVYGQGVTFTATVTVSGGGTPTGTVTFFVSGRHLADVTLKRGVAIVTVDSSQWPWINSAPVTARYAGDQTHAPSASHAVLLRVPAPVTTTTTTPAKTPPSTTTSVSPLGP